MKNTSKIRVSFRETMKVIIPFTLIIIVLCFCDTTNGQRVNTEPVTNIIVETPTATDTITNTTTSNTTATTSTSITTTTSTSYTTSMTTTVATTTSSRTTTNPPKTYVSTTTTIINTTVVTEAPIEVVTTYVSNESNTSSESFIGTFSRGTFYTTGSYGGSGRNLVSGHSIASRAIYEMYGYGNYKIRIECDAYPELNGIYSLDDCSAAGNYEVIDFWFAPNAVPSYFRKMGVFEVRAYIIR